MAIPDSPDPRPESGPAEGRLIRKRRTLPHWHLGGSTYFLTYRCVPGRVLDAGDRTIVLDNWKHWDGLRYSLHAVVVMPDHVHVLLTPARAADRTYVPLADILRTNKGFSSRAIGKRADRGGTLWQDERYDRIIRDEEEFREKWDYMLKNPMEGGLCSRAEDYPWWYGKIRATEEPAEPSA